MLLTQLAEYLQEQTLCTVEGGDSFKDDELDIIALPSRKYAVVADPIAPALGPTDNSLRRYSLGHHAAMHGEPKFTSDCSYRRPDDSACYEEVSVFIFADGFATLPKATLKSEMDVTPTKFAAFTVLSMVHDVPKIEDVTMRLTMFAVRETTQVHSFSFCGQNAVDACSKLLQAMHSAQIRFTASLFPPHDIVVSPVPNVELTQRRILAGYLLMFENYREAADASVCIVYGDLGSYHSGEATLTIYTNDRCASQVDSFKITGEVPITTYGTDYCSIFEVDCCHFCARTRDEMLLWTRALINVKIKLLHGAPNPTEQDLEVFRSAVLEQVVQLEDIPTSAQALLPLKPRQPLPPAVPGDQAQLGSKDDDASLDTSWDCSSQEGVDAEMWTGIWNI